MIRGHGGNIHALAREMGCSPADILDMSSNMNALGPAPEILEFLAENLPALQTLPEADGETLTEALARRHGLDPASVLPGNGTTQFIFTAPLALRTEQALVLGPTYADYADACRMHGVAFDSLIAGESELFQPDLRQVEARLAGVDTVFLCNPNNPTGTLIPRETLAALCAAHPRVRFVIDESYLAFSDRHAEATMIRCGLDNALVLHSYSKIYGVPGLRLGFLIASPGAVERFREFYQPWCVNALAQAAGRFLIRFDHPGDGFMQETRAFYAREKKGLREGLERTGALKVFGSEASFLLARIKGRLNAPGLCVRMSRERILLRDCSNFQGLSDRFIRIAPRDPEANARVVRKLAEILA